MIEYAVRKFVLSNEPHMAVRKKCSGFFASEASAELGKKMIEVSMVDLLKRIK